MLLYPMANPKVGPPSKTTRTCHKYHFVVYYPSCSWKEQHRVIYFISVFLRLVTFSCVFFFEVLASAPPALRVFVVGFERHLKLPAGDRSIARWDFCRQKFSSWFLQLRATRREGSTASIEMENADWKWITDSQFLMYCILKGIRHRISYYAVLHVSQLNGSWLKTNSSWILTFTE